TPENIVSVEQKTQATKITSAPRPGSSSDEIFTITGLKRGTATLHFYLARGWEQSSVAPADERDIRIIVE
ncbi:MAG: protease inhibitor I42 family protein, partial [Ferruginibacter sp.]